MIDAMARSNAGPMGRGAFTARFFDRQWLRPQRDAYTLDGRRRRPMRRMIGKELDRCGNHLSRASRNRNADRLTAAYNFQDCEEFLQRDVFTPKNVTLAASAALHGKHQAVRNILHVDKVHNKIKVELNSPVHEYCSIEAGGVRLGSFPIGIVGLATTTGKPDAAASKARCSADIFERV